MPCLRYISAFLANPALWDGGGREYFKLLNFTFSQSCKLLLLSVSRKYELFFWENLSCLLGVIKEKSKGSRHFSILFSFRIASKKKSYTFLSQWPKDHVYRMVIVEGRCTIERSSSFRSKLFIGWHKSIVSSDWSDTMVWFGQILLYFYYYHPIYMILAMTPSLTHLGMLWRSLE